MASSQACASTCFGVHPRITKLLSRQHASASESVSFAALVPGLGCWFWEVEVELKNHANELTVEMPMSDPSHSFQPPLLCSSWASRPPIVNEGNPGGPFHCWVISKMTLPASLICNMADFTTQDSSFSLFCHDFQLDFGSALQHSSLSVFFCSLEKILQSSLSNLKEWWCLIFSPFFNVIVLASGWWFLM